ncbi:unnamed protein product [Rhizophagus irregularis]|nr:unnamed protein product [Rhizophagus irregularis]
MWQKKVLIHLVCAITQLNQEKSDNLSTDTKTEVPSLFIILIILALMKFIYNSDKKLNPKDLTPKFFFEFGEVLAHSTIFAKNELKLHKKSLESPISIEEYRASFSLCLVQFYDEWKIWLPQTMASLYRKPKLLSSLQGILKIVNITSHTQRHECNLEKIRTLLVDPTSRILREENIWNLVLEAQEIIQDQQQLFGQNSFSQKTFHTFNLIFEKLLAFSENFTYHSDFDESDIHNQIMTYFTIGCNFELPNIVILDARDPSSSDSAVYKCLKISKLHNVQSRKEKIWELVHQLVNAFEFANPLENLIFEFCNNINDKGIDQLVAAYEIGINRLQKIVNQEILLTENYTTVRRRERNITRVMLADIAKMKKERKLEEREERGKEKKNKRGRGRGRRRGSGRGRKRESGDDEEATA